jgi:lipid-A-disaccharide synthase-like uncharacterized protein
MGLDHRRLTCFATFPELHSSLRRIRFPIRIRIRTWFWFLSIGGSLMLLVNAIHQKEPVFALGYSFNSIPYIRNLMLLHKEKKAKQSGAA